MTCSCASKRVVWITRLPSESLLSNNTLLGSEDDVGEVGGAIVTASRRKLRMLLPNLRSASSAASSARSISFRRFAASLRKRESMPSASLTMSAGRYSGRSGCAGELGSSGIGASFSIGTDDEASVVG